MTLNSRTGKVTFQLPELDDNGHGDDSTLGQFLFNLANNDEIQDCKIGNKWVLRITPNYAEMPSTTFEDAHSVIEKLVAEALTIALGIEHIFNGHLITIPLTPELAATL